MLFEIKKLVCSIFFAESRAIRLFLCLNDSRASAFRSSLRTQGNCKEIRAWDPAIPSQGSASDLLLRRYLLAVLNQVAALEFEPGPRTVTERPIEGGWVIPPSRLDPRSSALPLQTAYSFLFSNKNYFVKFRERLHVRLEVI